MKRRIIMEHIPTGKVWESDWVESDVPFITDIEVVEYPQGYAISFPFNGCKISIPPAILNECVRTTEYWEE